MWCWRLRRLADDGGTAMVVLSIGFQLKEPAHLLAGGLAVPPRDRAREQRPLCGDLGPGVASPNDDERAPSGSLVRIIARGRQFHLANDVIPQVQGLGHPAEAVRVLGDARNRQQLVDAARGQDQPVVPQLVGLPFRVRVRAAATSGSSGK